MDMDTSDFLHVEETVWVKHCPISAAFRETERAERLPEALRHAPHVVLGSQWTRLAHQHILRTQQCFKSGSWSFFQTYEGRSQAEEGPALLPGFASTPTRCVSFRETCAGPTTVMRSLLIQAHQKIAFPTVQLRAVAAASDQALELTEANVEKVLDEIRPYLMADGGNVEFVEIDGPVVYLRSGSLRLRGWRVRDHMVVTQVSQFPHPFVGALLRRPQGLAPRPSCKLSLMPRCRLQGACGSCPSSLTTMTMGIKRRLMESIPVGMGLTGWCCNG